MAGVGVGFQTPEVELELELKPPELELELIFWRLAGVGVGVEVDISGVGVELILWSWSQPWYEILKKGTVSTTIVKISLQTLSFVIKTQPTVRNSCFCHVYGSAFCFKIVHDITQHFVATISNQVWQPSWILIPLIRKFYIYVNNSSRVMAIKTSIYRWILLSYYE